MKKPEQKSSRKTLALLPPEKDATGDFRVYRDFKGKPNEEAILYFEDSKKDLLIRELLEQDIKLVKDFQNKQVQVIARKYGSLQKVLPSHSAENINFEIAEDSNNDFCEFSLLIFKNSTNELLAIADVNCVDFENKGTVEFLFSPGVQSKYRNIVKEYFIKFLFKYNILKNATEKPNILEKEYGIKI